MDSSLKVEKWVYTVIDLLAFCLPVYIRGMNIAVVQSVIMATVMLLGEV